MELYQFTRQALIWTAIIAALWPLNIPLAVLAHKVRLGGRESETDIDSDEVWPRAALGTLIAALMTLAVVALDWWIVASSDFPAGIVHLITFSVFVVLGTYIFRLYFALDDPFEALSLWTLYLGLPIVPMLILHGIFGVWGWPLRYVGTWLVPVGS